MAGYLNRDKSFVKDLEKEHGGKSILKPLDKRHTMRLFPDGFATIIDEESNGLEFPTDDWMGPHYGPAVRRAHEYLWEAGKQAEAAFLAARDELRAELARYVESDIAVENLEGKKQRLAKLREEAETAAMLYDKTVLAPARRNKELAEISRASHESAKNVRRGKIEADQSLSELLRTQLD